jgi:uncharacterized protein (TIGR00251 family)
MGRVKKFSNGRHGVALSVRVIPRANRNEIVEILSDQTVKIRLKAPPVEGKANEELINFLSKILDIPKSNFEIVGGKTGRDKLISILDADNQEVNRKILENLS